VRVDGHDIRELDLPHLRSNVGVVMQQCFLFRGTVRENIAATKPDATLEEIVDAASMAGADEFIKNLTQGYDTLLEEGGTNLSGGQQQRLSSGATSCNAAASEDPLFRSAAGRTGTLIGTAGTASEPWRRVPSPTSAGVTKSGATRSADQDLARFPQWREEHAPYPADHDRQDRASP
jgi:hypothetical protein